VSESEGGREGGRKRGREGESEREMSEGERERERQIYIGNSQHIEHFLLISDICRARTNEDDLHNFVLTL
jgi:hypothetical protein